MNIISRSGWGARGPRSRYTTSWSRRTEFVVHYSEGPTGQSVRSIQDFHMDGRRWSDIGYNFLVDTSGRIYEGRGWLVVGAHAENHNTSGIGVCMIGRDGDDTPAARRAIRALYDEANRRAGRTLARRGHRDVYPTDCPGEELYEWVRAGMPVSGTEDDVSAEDVWNYGIDTGDGKAKWRASTVLGHLEKAQDETHALLKQALGKLDAQSTAIGELARTVGALAADRGQEVDVDALVSRIEAAIERVSVRLEVDQEHEEVAGS